ncbi:hypothetical protein DYB36_005028 [Aphanomyces astaci]|uniref:PHD-type domain-containing protein n=1 Tax=Aphanomyces astaci TaxID=112090 RepID=A0A397B871_APHAT|nr:hypothetical protein DYB36_005028 [Aphanomyces astaci]
MRRPVLLAVDKPLDTERGVTVQYKLVENGIRVFPNHKTLLQTPAPLALTASSTVVLVPNPKQHALPEQQTHILPDASQVVGSHTWKVTAYKDALTRKLPLVGRCSFIQHGLCHVCTATATTNTNPALVLNVCPHFEFGHSVCVVHFEQLTRTLVSSMLEQGGGGGVPACPVCLHGCTCAVCTRVLTTQIELYDAYRASTSTSRGPSEYQGDVAANSLSPPWLHPNATSSGDVAVRQASITTSATRERTTSTRPTPPSYHGLIDADNLSDAASAQLWRRKPSSLLPPMMQADAKQAMDELVRRGGPDSVTGFSPSSKAIHHPITRAREHPDGTGVVPSYPDVGPAQRRWESRPAHDEAKHTQDDDNHVSRDSGLIDGAAVTADEKKSPAAAMLPLQSFKETQRKQQASVVQQPKAASKAIAPTTTLTTHGGKQEGGMAAEPKGGLAIAPKQASKDIAGTTSHTALKRSAAKAHERDAATTPTSRRPASSKKKAKRSHDDDDEATSPSAPGKRVCTIKRETPVDDDVKIESDDDDDDVDTNLDFCSICKQDGDLVCCDVCPRSFHLTCLNKREDQLPLDTWQCHECQHNLSDTHVQKVCRDLTKLRNKALTMRSILTGICSHPFAKPFLAPVADVEYYDDVVEYRMDLGEVSSRLDRHEYDGDDVVSNAFVRDVQLVWNNCRLFNDDNSGLARAANTLDADFHKMLQAAAATKNSRGAIRTKKQ